MLGFLRAVGASLLGDTLRLLAVLLTLLSIFSLLSSSGGVLFGGQSLDSLLR